MAIDEWQFCIDMMALPDGHSAASISRRQIPQLAPASHPASWGNDGDGGGGGATSAVSVISSYVMPCPVPVERMATREAVPACGAVQVVGEFALYLPTQPVARACTGVTVPSDT